MNPLRSLRNLWDNRSGVAMTEFAIGAPFLLMAGLGGVEIANYALVTMKVNQLAVHLADNASRVGDTSTLQNRKVYESDMNDILVGANIHAGSGIDLYKHGRVIISSLEIWDPSSHHTAEVSKAPGVQFIHWQRCLGTRNVNSSYGSQNAALPDGMGPEGQEISAEVGSGVIFVELSYEYQPLISDKFVGDRTISSIASFMVRDSRDQSGLLQRNPAEPDEIANCARYTDGSELLS